jgi:hypothetical protein
MNFFIHILLACGSHKTYIDCIVTIITNISAFARSFLHFLPIFCQKKYPSRQNDCLPPISAYGMMEENTTEGVIQNEKMASGRKRRLLSDLQ